MSKSNRDIRAWKARNPSQYFQDNQWYKDSEKREELDSWFYHRAGSKNRWKPNGENMAWSIVGKRRRNSTRKSNQRTKQMVHQMLRAQLKSETFKLINKDLLS